MEVKVISGLGGEHTWSLPKALLSRFSGYFRRACRPDAFIEGHSNKIVVPEFDPDVFEMFIEFIYFGRYTYKDDLADLLRVRDSEKAWVLGDYLDVVEFKNFAICRLHTIYMAPGWLERRTIAIGPEMVSYCCSKTASRSRLYLLIKAFLVQNWHRKDLVYNDISNRHLWDLIWEQQPELVADLLHFTRDEKHVRIKHERELENYLEPSDPELQDTKLPEAESPGGQILFSHIWNP